MSHLSEPAKEFIKALASAEQTRGIQQLVSLFTPQAEVRSIALKKPLTGPDGVKRFWLDYLGNFESVRSSFTHTHSSQDLTVLEWKSEGTLLDGTAINYQGVSILEYSADKISRFRTYYDSAAFLPEGAKLLGREVTDSAT